MAGRKGGEPCCRSAQGGEGSEKSQRIYGWRLRQSVLDFSEFTKKPQETLGFFVALRSFCITRFGKKLC
jgi:hypothetical protein